MDVDGPASWVSALVSREATAEHWWSPHVWRDDYREKSACEQSCGVVIDLDYHNEAGEHVMHPPDVAARIDALARARGLGGTLWHVTPRGARLVFVLSSPVEDEALYTRIANEAAARVEAGLRISRLLRVDYAGYVIDRAVLLDRGRLLFAPRSRVDSEPSPRDADVAIVGDAYATEELAPTVTEIPEPTPDAYRPPPSEGGRPGDNFAASTSWAQILEPHGWQRVGSRGDEVTWRRPGKDHGVSATTNYKGSDLFYAFTTSTPFTPNRGYGKFGAWALLNHGGDHSAAARDLVSRGLGGEPPEIPDVDLSLILDRDHDDDAPTIDEDLMRVPGLVGELADWINETSHKPQPILALGAAIAAVSAIVGRKVRLKSGLRSNIYVLGVAPSGTGKERAREALRQVFEAAGAGDLAAYDNVASDAAINNALQATPACLFLLDEAGREFAQMMSANAPSHIAAIVSVLLKLYGASSQTYYGKTYADVERRLKVDQPCLSIYGTTVPRNLYASLTPEQVNDGFLGRFLIFESNDQDPPFRDVDWQEPPAPLVAQFERWHQLEAVKQGAGNLERFTPEPMIVKMSSRAVMVFRDLETDMRRRRTDIRVGGDDPGIFMRVGTSARKLALIRACGITHESPEISESDATWGVRLAVSLAQAVASKVKRFAAESRYEADLKRVTEIVRSAGRKNGISKTGLLNKTKWLNPRTREEIIRHLEESGSLVAKKDEQTKGRPATRYFHALPD